MREFLNNTFPNNHWSFDKTWKTGSALKANLRFRPDALTKTDDRVTIVEVDEHSHAPYDCPKEREREAVFVASAKSEEKSLGLVRFNTDGYRDESGRYFPTCFHTSPKSGLVTVDPKQKKQWNARLAKLKEAVARMLDPDIPVPPPQFGRSCYTIEVAYADVAGNAAKKRSRSDV